MNKIIIIAISILPLGLFAQGETDWWYFGEHIGMHFVNDTVEAISDGQLSLFTVRNTSMSSSNGELYFYGSGGAINNSNHETMDSVNPLPSGSSAASLPTPQSDSLYAYFNLVHIEGPFGVENFLGYSTINMNAYDGLGEITGQEISTDTILNFIATIKKADGIDYWVVVRKPHGNTYITYSLDENGVDFSNPIYSDAGDDYLLQYENQQTEGSLRINPQGNLLAFTHSTHFENNQLVLQGKLELFHFNNETGQVGERILKLDEINASASNVSPIFGGYGLEYSTDGEKLYYTQSGMVYQCNIAVLDSVSILSSILRFNDFIAPYQLADLQLAKDGRLYISSGQANSIALIHHPNIFGADANFELIGLELESGSGDYLPHFDPSFFSPGFTVSNRCLFDETQFELIYDLPYEYVFWEFGDGDSSTEWEPTHVYSETGIYTVQLTTVIEEDTTIKEMEVIIEGYPSVDLGPDSSLFCEGDTLVLDAYNYASYYTWQDSSYQSTFEVTDEGKFYVEVKNICGQASDTVEFVLDRDNVHLGTDTLICVEEPLLLMANQPTATSWLWQDGSTLPFYEAQQTGEYYVEVTTPCLFIYDSIYVDTKVCSLLPPNIITPNGDGINDYFVVDNLYEFGYTWSIEIFNRWGQQVYFSENYQNNWKGEHVNDGVYFYVLKSQDTDRSYNGSVTVLRK